MKELEVQEKAARSGQEQAEKEALMWEAEMKHVQAQQELVEKVRRAALLKAQGTSKAMAETSQSAKEKAAKQKAANDEWLQMSEKMWEEAAQEYDLAESFWRDADRDLTQAEEAEEQARRDAEEAWYKATDEDAAKKEEEQFWEDERGNDEPDPYAYVDKGDLWGDFEEQHGGDGQGYFMMQPQTDDEVFLMLLLQSMGACQIETEGLSSNDPDQNIDDVIERAFDALAMRQEERDAQVRYTHIDTFVYKEMCM